MLDLITAYLIQTKDCSLPGLGSFRIKYIPAEIDIVNKLMLPPEQQLVFKESAGNVSKGLVTYLSVKKNISEEESEEKVNQYCKEAKLQLLDGEVLEFNSLGTLQKNSNGNLYFTAKPLEYFQPVPAERVIHQHAHHDVLVGDKETTSGAMTAFYQTGTPISKSYTLLIGLLITVITLAFLVYYFMEHPFTTNGIGSR